MIAKMFVSKANNQSDAESKALAYFLFREIIEDAHSKYNISQDDMRTMCKEAVNRADAFLKIQQDAEAYHAFKSNAIYAAEWDDADKAAVQEIYDSYCHLCDPD